MNIENKFERSPKIKLLGLAIAIGVCFSFAAIGGLATTSSVNGWYTTIEKPTWNPPDWIFGPVWSFLYFTMGLAAWLVWKDQPFSRSRFPLSVFLIQLILNSLWSILFFGMHQIGWAFVDISLLWLAIVATLVLFFRHSQLAGLLLIPYLGWVTFAGFLNYTIWTLN